MDFCSIYFKTGPAIVQKSHILDYRVLECILHRFSFFTPGLILVLFKIRMNTAGFSVEVNRRVVIEAVPRYNLILKKDHGRLDPRYLS